jgi:hypothetical protein
VDYFRASLRDIFHKVSFAAARDSKGQVKTASTLVLRDLDPRLHRLLPLVESDTGGALANRQTHGKFTLQVHFRAHELIGVHNSSRTRLCLHEQYSRKLATISNLISYFFSELSGAPERRAPRILQS